MHGLKSDRTGKARWPVLLVLAFGWLAQLPFLHQIHLAFDSVEHIWCPRHQRLEHLDAQWNRGEWIGAERLGSKPAIGSATGKIEHQACALSLMHQPVVPLLQAHNAQTYLPELKTVNRFRDFRCCCDILHYAPKLSPPSAA
jgi:hypothetical protein